MPNNRPNSESEQELYALIEQFAGVNRNAPRWAIADNEFYYLLNCMPYQDGNISSLPGHDASQYTNAGKAIANVCGYVRGNSPFLLVFFTDGSAVELRVTGRNTLAAPVSVAAAATFSGGAIILGLQRYSDATVWENTTTLIIDPTKGYFSWDGTTLTNISATQTGYTIAVHEGRVWLGNKRVLSYTGTAGFNDFNVANGAGAYSVTSNGFQSDIHRIHEANSYLFIFGDNAIGAIGSLKFSNGITLFGFQILVAGQGSYINSRVIDFDGLLIFLNRAGAYALTGPNPEPLTDDALRNFWPTLSLTYGSGATGCMAYINGVRMPLIMVGNGGAAFFLMFMSGKWFFGNDGGLGITGILSVLNLGEPFMFGWGAHDIYPIFSNSANALTAQIVTKAFDFGNKIFNKDIQRFAIEGNFSAGALAITGTVDSFDSVNGSQTVPFNAQTNAAGFNLVVVDAGSSSGKYIGFTINITLTNWVISCVHIEYDEGTPF